MSITVSVCEKDFFGSRSKTIKKKMVGFMMFVLEWNLMVYNGPAIKGVCGAESNGGDE
jgi:hypothetical protein